MPLDYDEDAGKIKIFVNKGAEISMNKQNIILLILTKCTTWLCY